MYTLILVVHHCLKTFLPNAVCRAILVGPESVGLYHVYLLQRSKSFFCRVVDACTDACTLGCTHCPVGVVEFNHRTRHTRECVEALVCNEYDEWWSGVEVCEGIIRTQ